jgi:hypothetical protein
VKLSEQERELLHTEVAQALDQVRSPELKVRYGELLTAIDQGEVPDDLVEPLQTLLEVGLESGRIRKVHTPHGEMAARRLFSRTPRGAALQSSAAEVNEALRALAGHTLEELSVGVTGPGQFSVSVGTSEGKLLLTLDRQGVRLKTVEVGG